VGGIIGTICLGVFASTQVNPGGVDGLLISGNVGQLVKQMFGVAVVGGYTLVVSWIILKGVDMFMGIRPTEENEVVGLDSVEHSETAYNH